MDFILSWFCKVLLGISLELGFYYPKPKNLKGSLFTTLSLAIVY